MTLTKIENDVLIKPSVQTVAKIARALGVPMEDLIKNNRMTKKRISSGTVHKIPADLRKVLTSSPAALAAWEDITLLARNEWICWIESVKKPETRKLHIKRTHEELIEGKRRPCCWAGCIHR